MYAVPTSAIDDSVNEILEVIANKMEYEVEHSSLGDCPECYGDALKQFAKMLKNNESQ